MFKKILKATAVLVALVSSGPVFGQAGDYTFAVSSSTFTPIVGGTDVNSVEADISISAAIPIGFTFEFDGASYTSVKVGSDGFLSFNSSAGSGTTNDLDNGTASRRPLVAPLWDDHQGSATTSNSKASYVVTGTAPNRVFTFEWLNWEWNWNANDSVVSFQVKLYETTNEVQFAYRWQNASAISSPSASIGLSGATTFLSVSGIGSGTPTVSNSTEDNGIDTVVTDQVFTFTPPLCSSPIFNSVTDVKTDSATVNFTALGSGPFYINYGSAGFTQGAAGSFYDTVTASPFILHGLTDDKTYDFYIQTDCGANGVSQWVGANSFTTVPSCLLPVFSSFSNVTSDSITINWTGTGSGPWYVYWGPTGFDQATPGVSLDTSTSTSFIAHGLTGGTSYSFFIKEDCGGGDTSSYAGPFTTNTVYVPPYMETFADGYPGADYTEGAGFIGNPTVFTSTTSSAWKQDGFSNVGTTGATSLNIYGTSRREWFFGPSIDLGDGTTTYQVEFDASVTDWNGTGPDAMGPDDSVVVVVSTDNGATWSRSNMVLALTASDNIPNGAGLHFSASLAGYTGIVKIGVYAESTLSNTDYDFHIDNFQVRIPPACPDPTLLSSTLYGVDSVIVSWKSSASSFNYNYGVSPTAAGTGTPIATTDTFVVLTGLTGSTMYDFHVQASCSGGSSLSTYLAYPLQHLL